jgi:hypothetical protein
LDGVSVPTSPDAGTDVTLRLSVAVARRWRRRPEPAHRRLAGVTRRRDNHRPRSIGPVRLHRHDPARRHTCVARTPGSHDLIRAVADRVDGRRLHPASAPQTQGRDQGERRDRADRLRPSPRTDRPQRHMYIGRRPAPRPYFRIVVRRRECAPSPDADTLDVATRSHFLSGRPPQSQLPLSSRPRCHRKRGRHRPRSIGPVRRSQRHVYIGRRSAPRRCFGIVVRRRECAPSPDADSRDIAILRA